ncbi:MAG: FKBP-type peptidyl-prolyl cis-trans isomerase [Actinomycetota bacterium]
MAALEHPILQRAARSLRAALGASLALVSMTSCGALGTSCHTTEVTTPTGLRVEDLRCGDGDAAAEGDEVSIRYEGTLESGGVFDPAGREGASYRFVVGAGQVIAGWDEGLEGMREGGVRRLVVPPGLAFGERGVPRVVPPNATVVYEIELTSVEPTQHS